MQEGQTVDQVTQELETKTSIDLASILAPFPEVYALPRISDEEYAEVRKKRLTEKVADNESVHPYSSLPFDESEMQNLAIDMFWEGVHRGDFPKQTGEKIISRIRLFFSGIAKPKAFIDRALRHSGLQKTLYEHASSYLLEDITAVDYKEIAKIGKNIRENFPNYEPSLVIRAAEEIGLVITSTTKVDGLPASFETYLKSYSEGSISEGLKVLRSCRWLEFCTTYASDSEELISRIAIALNSQSLTSEQEERLRYQDTIYSIFRLAVGGLHDVLNFDHFPDLLMVGQETVMVTNEGTEQRNILRGMLEYPKLLQLVAERLRNGYRFATRNFETALMNFAPHDAHKIQQFLEKVEVSPKERSVDQSKIASVLDLEGITDSEIVQRIDEGLCGVVSAKYDYAAKSAIIIEYCLGNFSLSYEKTSRNAGFASLHKAGSMVNLLNLGASYRSVKEGINDKRKKLLDRLLMRALFTLPDGSFDTELFKYLMYQMHQTGVNMHLFMDEAFVTTIDRPDRNVVQLFMNHQKKINYRVIDYIKDHYDEVKVLISNEGDITVPFVRTFFSERFTHNDSIQEIGPLIDASGILPGFTDYINLIQKRLMKESSDDMPMARYYVSLVDLFVAAESQGKRIDANDIDALNFWKKYDQRALVASLSKSGLAELVGENASNAFLGSLPKVTQERRNALLHNPFDRTSQWLIRMINETNRQQVAMPEIDNLVFQFPEEIDCATVFISNFGLSKNHYLFSIFRLIYMKEQNADFQLPQFVQKFDISSVQVFIEQYKQIENFLTKKEQITNLRQFTSFQLMLLGTATGVDTHKFVRSVTIEELSEKFMERIDAGAIAPASPEHQVVQLEINAVDLQYTPSDLVRTRIAEIREMVQEIASTDDPRSYWQSLRDEIVQDEQHQILDKTKDKLLNADSEDELFLALQELDSDKSLEKKWSQIVEKIVLKKLMFSNLLPPQLDALIEQEGVSSELLLSLMTTYGEMIKHHIVDFLSDRSEEFWTGEVLTFFRNPENKNYRKKVGNIFVSTVNKLASDVSRFESIKKQSSSTISLYPDRGFLGQLSGYIANACYTRETNILEQWAVTPYRIVDEAKQPPSLIGNFLLFDVRMADGKSAILLRALNIPEENGYDIPVICEKIIDAAAEVAKRQGASAVLIPGSDGAISNYGRTLVHMNAQYIKDRTPVSLDSEFAFNGYKLTDNCFVARSF